MTAEIAMNIIAKTARTVSYARDTVSAKPLTSVAPTFGSGALAAFLIGRFTR